MLWAATVVSQTNYGPGLGTNQTPELAVALLPGELVGQEQVFRGLIKNGTNEFMFVVPEGFRTEAPGEGRILLIRQDMKCYVSIRIAEPLPTNPELKEVLREQIASQYPRASSLSEFTATVANRKGAGFELRQELPGVAPRRVSILWVPFKAGVLEFALYADSDSASAGRAAFDMILVTFRSNERGEIEIVIRSDKT
jgi:hypothetical protein